MQRVLEKAELEFLQGLNRDIAEAEAKHTQACAERQGFLKFLALKYQFGEGVQVNTLTGEISAPPPQTEAQQLEREQ